MNAVPPVLAGARVQSEVSNIDLLRVVHTFTCLIFLAAIAVPAACQHRRADSIIIAVDGFKKFKIERRSPAELAAMNAGDTAARVLELSRFTAKKGFGKMVQRSRFYGTELKRTCYFEKGGRLAAICDSVWYANKTTHVFTYYWEHGKFSAVDEDRRDATARIDEKQIYDWLCYMFSKEEVDDWIAR